MTLNKCDLETLLEIAMEAALSAAKVIKNSQNSHKKFKIKNKNLSRAASIVTETDLQAQDAIFKILSPTISDFDLGVLTEESEDNKSRFKKDYFWSIDPLDGTLAFTRNQSGYSVSIALVNKLGEAVLGVVVDPVKECLYRSIKGQGAFKNNSPFNQVNSGKILTIIHDESFLKYSSLQTELMILNIIAKDLGFNEIKLIQFGGAVMNGISTIELAPAIYYKLPKMNPGGGSLWDFSANSLIQSEAGGYNSDFYGKPLELNKECGTFMGQKGVIFASSKKISKLLKKHHQALSTCN